MDTWETSSAVSVNKRPFEIGNVVGIGSIFQRGSSIVPPETVFSSSYAVSDILPDTGDSRDVSLGIAEEGVVQVDPAYVSIPLVWMLQVK